MNEKKLLDTMRAANVSIREMCTRLGMSRSAFYRKTHGISEFTLKEIQAICAILDLSSPVDIFFTEKVS